MSAEDAGKAATATEGGVSMTEVSVAEQVGDYVIDAFAFLAANPNMKTSEKLVLAAVAFLSPNGDASVEAVAEITGLKVSLCDGLLRSLAKQYPDQVKRRAWLDDNERKRVSYKFAPAAF